MSKQRNADDWMELLNSAVDELVSDKSSNEKRMYAETVNNTIGKVAMFSTKMIVYAKERGEKIPEIDALKKRSNG